MISYASNYTEHLLILASTITGCVSNHALAFLVGIPVDIASSAITIKISVTTTGIKNCKSIIKKKEKLNTIKFLISEAFIDLNISHDEVVSVNNMGKEYDDLGEEVKNTTDK